MEDKQGWAIETANPFRRGNQSGNARNGERPTQPQPGPRSGSQAGLVESWISSTLARYIKFVHRTSWQTEAMTETLGQHYHNHPCIVAMWHGQFMLLPLIKPPFIPVDIMLARHRRRRDLGGNAAPLRYAADPRCRRGLAWPGPRRRARVHGGRAGATRRAHGGHDRRRTRWQGALGRAGHRHGRAAIRTARSCRSPSPPRAIWPSIPGAA